MADETTPNNENQNTNNPTEPITETSSKPVSLYDKTEAMVTRQEEANKKAEEILDRQEKLHANQRLAGTTGGHIEPVVSEETPKEYADKVMKGEIKNDGK